jgi:AhpD family alkylhydroperoxidase
MESPGIVPGGKRTYAGLVPIARDLAAALRGSRLARADRRRGAVPPAFRERIMLTVTQVNGCRWCSFAHARLALSLGVRSGDVKALLDGCVDGCPDEEVPALLYAQHWAGEGGRPAPDARARLVEAYGPERAAAIERAIRAINTANLIGNTFDALMMRLTRGRWTSAIRVEALRLVNG